MAWVIVFFIVAAFNALYGFIFPVIILPLFFNLTPLGQCNLRTMIEEVKRDFIISIEYYYFNEISKTDQFPMGDIVLVDFSSRTNHATAFISGFGK